MKFVYFAWVRETIGVDEEELTPPADVRTVAAMLDWLAGLDSGHGAALADRDRVKVAVDQEIATPDTPIGGAKEIALFPPVTGG